MKESGLKILCGAAKIEIHAHDDTDKMIGGHHAAAYFRVRQEQTRH